MKILTTMIKLLVINKIILMYLPFLNYRNKMIKMKWVKNRVVLKVKAIKIVMKMKTNFLHKCKFWMMMKIMRFLNFNKTVKINKIYKANKVKIRFY